MSKKNQILQFMNIALLVVVLLCGCSNRGNSDSENNLPEATENEFIGDWHGTMAYTNEYGESIDCNVILSINSDRTWASSIDKYAHVGTWELQSEDSNKLELTVDCEGVDSPKKCSFEQKEDKKFFQNSFVMKDEAIEMTKMKDAPKEELCGEWKNIVDEQNESMEYDVSLSISTDNTWMCSVNNNTNSGHLSYISEAGHLIILKVEDKEDGILVNLAFLKDIDNHYYFRYDYYRNIHFQMENS